MEIKNNAANVEDVGTIWFDDCGAEEKMIQFLETLDLAANGVEDNMDRADLRILDLGTGNGHLLFEMKERGWLAEMVGVDYALSSINLARQIQKTCHADAKNIRFAQWDIISETPGTWEDGGFDVVLDKGTFDAISLSDQVHSDGHRGCELYAPKIVDLIKKGGYLLITSCNWTTHELTKWLESPTLHYHDSLHYPSFTFGGVEGQSVSTVCFRKIESLA